MPSTPLTLKIQEGSKLASFVAYYEDFHSEVSDTGRNRKGNVKKFLLQELECLVSTGKPAEFPAEGRAVAKSRGVKFGRKKTYTEHQEAEVLKKRSEGEGYGTIARSLGMSRSMVQRIVKEQMPVA